MRNDANTSDALIIGAGMCGLMAADTLLKRGVKVTLWDKGSSVGGRLATRRIGPGRADHGAQFFTVRSDRFGGRVERWQQEGLVFVWAQGWSDGSLGVPQDTSHARYAVRGGMNNLAKSVAQDLEQQGVIIRTHTRARSVRLREQGWQVEDETGLTQSSKALILTAPVPQSLGLLDSGAVVLSPNDRNALERIEYAPSLCAMFWIEGDVDLPYPGVLQRPGHAISWIADNQRKGISPDARLITVHASADYSIGSWERSDDEIIADLQAEVLNLMKPPARVLEVQLKRWRYALATAVHTATYLEAQGLPNLFFAGDGFVGPRVEGAALSGLATGDRVGDLLTA